MRRDRDFYTRSGGGITLSGGEPLRQHGFCLDVLRQCRDAGLHVAIETSAFSRWEDLVELLPWLDLVILDIKLMDDAAQRIATGASNLLILENARRLAGAPVPLQVRTPVVPGVNDTSSLDLLISCPTYDSPVDILRPTVVESMQVND